jgi:hypothetical protein
MLTMPQKRAADEILAGFLEHSKLVRDFWVRGGMLRQRRQSSELYRITRHPEKPLTVARIKPGSGSSTRLELFMPPHIVSRLEFRAVCSDEQLARFKWANTKDTLILTLPTQTDDLIESRWVGQILGRLHRSGRFDDATFHP